MKVSIIAVSLCMMCLTGCGKDEEEDSATELENSRVGSRVFAEYQDGYWYSATITGGTDAQLKIKYDDGEISQVAGNRTIALQLPAGTCVVARWQGGGDYYAARVTAQQGENISLQYDDGEKEVTTPIYVVLKMQTNSKGRLSAMCFSASAASTGTTTGGTTGGTGQPPVY